MSAPILILTLETAPPMRFISPTVLPLGLFLLAQPAYSQDASRFQTNAPHAAIIDFNSNEVLFTKDAERPMPPASMTKIMTAFMVFEALESGRITMDTEFNVSEEAWRRGGAKSGSSTMFLDLNSTARVEDLLRGVIVQSGNDACIVLAEGLAGSESAFAELMTQRAHELGLKTATFLNSTGWPDAGHEISALDLAKLADMMIRRFPQYYGLYNERSFTWNGIKQSNRNPLLGRFTGADGLKTGHTEISGYGLVGSAKRGDDRRIIVINGTGSSSERRDTAISLMNAAFTQFKVYDVFTANQIVGDVDVYMGKAGTIPVETISEVKVGLPRVDRASLRSELHAKMAVAPIEKGDVLGEVIVYQGDSVIDRVDVIASESMKEKSSVGKVWTSLLKTIRG
ncbi:D-alanyl-D-alanine carboxypeptidase (penicillin-binding protein 5/6) [Litorimonas taeanensis]|uniref:serine-type D-Ala-D-Ala carboxypeptidase n=2 Tax=Litorimonas taeanensis TaxID=568099 RepID=A0A420WKE2_9PROT|nr:D-alanyl-D-alanine carboxypeptidase (penicillin-binding protein 5/6) [Litorimonas taeanensis]